MRIGIDAHNLEGHRTGVGRYLMCLLNEWRKLNSDIEFFLYFKNQIPDDLSFSPFFHSKKTDSRLGQKSTAFFVHFALPKMANRDKVDILFCPAYIAPLFYPANGAGKGKIALALHDIIYQVRPELYNWPSIWDKILLKWVSKVSAKKAKVILACSEFSRKEIIKHYQIGKDKVKVVPLAADSTFCEIEDEALLLEAKRKYNLPDKFLFFIGSIFSRRHLPEAIEAFSQAAGELKQKYHFIIIGENYANFDIDEFIEAKNKRLSYEAIRHIRIASGDLPSVYNLASLFIYLSDYEGFGLPVLEALACGTPVVTSATSSLPEVAGKAAMYVKNNADIQEIERVIRRGLTDEELRNRLASKGLEQAKTFSWQKCAQKTLEILQSVR